ncbi:MAG: glycosyltransferase involved in cell wall biosynthesis [Psychroserpens sp.]|jgi:glycosyltransferase involved in cell wall biosynthesis
MTNKPVLSYVLTTYNKLPYLEEVIKRLLENVQSDEEIVVTDGASNDGTVEFLASLYKQKKIHQFISEPDKGEAHGFNKAILMAKGELIKIITDDDVFDYVAIQDMRKYMLENNAKDVIIGNNAMANITELIQVKPIKEMFDEFMYWKSGEKSVFYSNGLSLMLRKSSLPLIGLFHTGFVAVDLEYTLRNSRIANIAFYTKCIAIRLVNESSNGERQKNRIKIEQDKLCDFYDYKKPETWQEIKKQRYISMRPGYWFLLLKRYLNNNNNTEEKEITISTVSDSFDYYHKGIIEYNRKLKPRYY